MCSPDAFTWNGCVFKDMVGWFSWRGTLGRRTCEQHLGRAVLPASGQGSHWSPGPSSATSCLSVLDKSLPLSRTQFLHLEKKAWVQCPWRFHSYQPGCGGTLAPSGQWSGWSWLGAAEFGAWDEPSAWLETEAISRSEGPLDILYGA